MASNPGEGGSPSPAQPPAQPRPAYPYQTEAPNAYHWTEIAYDYLMGGRLTAGIRSAGRVSTAIVSGTCPYCQDDVKFTQVLDAVTGESMRTLGQGDAPAAADDGYVPLTVSCACTGQHAGRPSGVTAGCGINFRIELRRDA